jgi:hypothetical protein
MLSCNNVVQKIVALPCDVAPAPHDESNNIREP